MKFRWPCRPPRDDQRQLGSCPPPPGPQRQSLLPYLPTCTPGRLPWQLIPTVPPVAAVLLLKPPAPCGATRPPRPATAPLSPSSARSSSPWSFDALALTLVPEASPRAPAVRPAGKAPGLQKHSPTASRWSFRKWRPAEVRRVVRRQQAEGDEVQPLGDAPRGGHSAGMQ